MSNPLQRFLVSVHHLTVHNVVLLQRTLDYVSLGELRILSWYLLHDIVVPILVVPIQVCMCTMSWEGEAPLYSWLQSYVTAAISRTLVGISRYGKYAIAISVLWSQHTLRHKQSFIIVKLATLETSLKQIRQGPSWSGPAFRTRAGGALGTTGHTRSQ